jgi:hypothetical protein
MSSTLLVMASIASEGSTNTASVEATATATFIRTCVQPCLSGILLPRHAQSAGRLAPDGLSNSVADTMAYAANSTDAIANTAGMNIFKSRLTPTISSTPSSAIAKATLRRSVVQRRPQAASVRVRHERDPVARRCRISCATPSHPPTRNSDRKRHQPHHLSGHYANLDMVRCTESIRAWPPSARGPTTTFEQHPHWSACSLVVARPSICPDPELNFRLGSNPAHRIPESNTATSPVFCGNTGRRHHGPREAVP